MQGIFQKENTDKALKYGIYRHLPTYEKIIRNLVSFYVKVYYSNKHNGCSPYHNGNIIAEEIPPELLSYMEEVLPEKKELDTEIVLDTMINVNEFLKN